MSAITKAEAAKRLKNETFRGFKLDGNGKPKLGQDKKPIIDEHPLGEDDILAVNEHDKAYHVITKDGQKHVLAK